MRKKRGNNQNNNNNNNVKNTPTFMPTRNSLQKFLELHKFKFTPKQHDLMSKIEKNEIIFVKGPAGTSKTFSTCYTALKLYKEEKVHNIILTKPLELSGEALGFLPGEYEQKIAPFYESFYHNIEKIIGNDITAALVREKIIQHKVTAYMRGGTFDDSIIIVDEAQNLDFRQLMLIISRLGKNSKIVVMGDVSQHDIRLDLVALPKFYEMIKDIEGVVLHEFTNEDVVRNPILIQITEKYDEYRANNMVTKNKKF